MFRKKYAPRIDCMKVKDLIHKLRELKESGAVLNHEKVLQELGYNEKSKKWFVTMLLSIFPNLTIDNQLQKIAEMDPETWGDKTLKNLYKPIFIRNDLTSKHCEDLKLNSKKTVENIKMKDFCLLLREYQFSQNINLSVILSHLGYSVGELKVKKFLTKIFPNFTVNNQLQKIAEMDPETWGDKTIKELYLEAKPTIIKRRSRKKHKNDQIDFNMESIDLEDGIEPISSQRLTKITTQAANFHQNELFGYVLEEAPAVFDYPAFLINDPSQKDQPQVETDATPTLFQVGPQSIDASFGYVPQEASEESQADFDYSTLLMGDPLLREQHQVYMPATPSLSQVRPQSIDESFGYIPQETSEETQADFDNSALLMGDPLLQELPRVYTHATPFLFQANPQVRLSTSKKVAQANPADNLEYKMTVLMNFQEKLSPILETLSINKYISGCYDLRVGKRLGMEIEKLFNTDSDIKDKWGIVEMKEINRGYSLIIDLSIANEFFKPSQSGKRKFSL